MDSYFFTICIDTQLRTLKFVLKKYIKVSIKVNAGEDFVRATEQNIKFFFPYRFKFDNEHAFLDDIKMLQTTISKEFQYSMQYRNI